MYLFPISTECRNLKQLKSLPDRPKLDVLNIDSKLMKLSADYIAPSLYQIFNLTLTQNYIPSDWKKAKITPIYKGKGSKLDPSNYRPISVVPHIAKILEKHVYSLCPNYLENHGLLTVDQSAFLQKHSTITSLHKVNDEWLESIENGEYI